MMRRNDVNFSDFSHAFSENRRLKVKIKTPIHLPFTAQCIHNQFILNTSNAKKCKQKEKQNEQHFKQNANKEKKTSCYSLII